MIYVILTKRLYLVLIGISLCLLPLGMGCGSGAATSTSSSDNGGSTTTSIPWLMFRGGRQHTGETTAIKGPQTNTLKWRYTNSSIESSTAPNTMSVDSNKNVYVVAGNKLLALNASSTLLWSADLGGQGGTALASNEATVYAVGGSKLYAYSTSTGSALWTFSEATETLFGEPCIGTDGVIYVGSRDTYVYAVNTNGTLKWKFQTGGSIAPLASPTLSQEGGTVFIGSGDPNDDTDGYVYALRTSDGSLVWKKQIDNNRASGVVVGADGTLYVNGSGRVYALNPTTGEKIWESSDGTASSLIPALSAGGTIYTGTGDGEIFALNATTGATKWSYQTGRNPNASGSHDPEFGVVTAIIIGSDGTIYAGAVDGKMYALKSDGTLLWTYETADSVSEICPALGPDGTLYFSSSDKYLYAIKDN